MNATSLFYVPVWLIILLLILVMLLIYQFGSWYKAALVRKGKIEIESPGTIEGSMLGLTALLLAFTFNMTATKFTERQKTIVEEANMISVAFLRCDLYPDSMRNLLRQDFRNYLQTRIDYYNVGDSEYKLKAALHRSDEYGLIIWRRVASYAQRPQSLIQTNQMVPAVNNMLDITITRDAQRTAKVPPFIFLVLFIQLLISAFFLGYQRKEKVSPIYPYAWAFMTCLTLFLMLELDRPRRGIINLHNSEQKIEELKTLINEQTK
jgi:hypothetical protein